MCIERSFKIILVFFVAVFCLFVGINNMIDYNVSFLFLKHVVSMDTVQPWLDPSIAAVRAITNPGIQVFLYGCIIMGELLAGLFAFFSGFKMLKNIKNDVQFSKAKNFYIVATGLMITVWYFGFLIIAANWFYMWGNTVDASQAAFNFSIFALLSLMYIMREELPR